MNTGLTVGKKAARSLVPSTVAGGEMESPASGNHIRAQRPAPARRYASDDEILGINSSVAPERANGLQPDAESQSGDGKAESGADNGGADEVERGARELAPEPNNSPNDAQLQDALDAHPELRQAWQDAQSYREAFATPEEARAATALLGDLDRMDTLFFSQRPEDHAELARAVANLDRSAFASLAKAMSNLAANGPHAAASNTQSTSSGDNQQQIPRTPSHDSENQSDHEMARDSARNDNSGAAQAQVEFLHAANAAAVQGVIDAIETQVDRLLPEGVSKTARNRMVGEIYRELDSNLGSNRQLNQQMRDAFRAGNLDAAHQRAVVSLVTGRARQALPGIAKRVLNEWTSTVVAANQDRLARQRAAAHRVDIAGSAGGADSGRRSLGPRDIDYGRMSDSDILNL